MNHRHILLVLMLVAVAAWCQNGMTDTRRHYLRHSLADTTMPAALRLAYADTLIANAKASGEDTRELLEAKAKLATDSGFYRQALAAYKGLPQTSGNLATLAQLLYYMGWYAQSMDVATRVARKGELKPEAYLDLAQCYVRVESTAQALQYVEFARQAVEQDKVSGERKRALDFKAEILLTAIAIIENKYTEVIDHLDLAEKLQRLPEDRVVVLTDRALIYTQMQDTALAHQIYEKVRHMPVSHYSKALAMNNYINFAIYELRQAELASKLCEENGALTNRLDIDHVRSKLDRMRSEIMAWQGDYEGAWNVMMKSTEMVGSLFTREKMAHIYGLGHEAQALERERAEREQRRRTTALVVWLCIAAAVALVSAGAFIVTWRRLRRQSASAEAWRSSSEQKAEEVATYLRRAASAEDKLREVSEICANKPDGGATLARVASAVKGIGQHAVAIGEHRMTREEVYDRLALNLRRDHPDITEAELTMASYVATGIPTKTIAGLLSIGVRSVENTKYRLSKRCGVGGADLRDYLVKHL